MSSKTILNTCFKQQTWPFLRLKWFILLLFIIGMLHCGSAVAVLTFNNYTGASGGNWNLNTNWSRGSVPGVGDSAVIGGNKTVQLNATSTAGSLWIQAGSTLDANNFVLTSGVNGTSGGLTIDGTYTDVLTGATNQKFIGFYIGGTGKWTVDANLKFNNAGMSVITVAGALTNLNFIGDAPGGGGGLLDLNSGTLTNQGTITITDPFDIRNSGTFINSTNATLNYNASANFPTTTLVLTASATGNTVSFGAQVTGTYTLPKPASFYNLKINGTGNTYTRNNVVQTILGDLTITNATLDVTGNTTDPTVQGNWINNGGSFTASTRTVIFNGTSTVSGTSATNFNNVTINAGKTLTGHSTNMNVAGNWANAGTFTHNSGTVTFNGTSTISGASVTSFNNVTINAASTLTGASAANVNVAGTWTNSGTYTHNSGTVTFNGTSQQTITGSGATTFYNLTNSNAAGISLSVNATVNNTLELSTNVITTNAYTMIIPAGGVVNRTGANTTNGYVDGKLQKNFATGATARTYELGSSSKYDPITVTYTNVSAAGNLICKSTSGNHPSVSASNVDPNKTVARYWTLTNSGITFTGSYSIGFTYLAAEASGTASNYQVSQFTSPTWIATVAPSPAPTTTATTIAGLTSTLYGDYQIGENFNPVAIYNAATGAINWNTQANWIQYRTGTISTSSASATVTGTSTLFTTEVKVGDILLSQTTPGTALGTITSIASNTSLTLTANATSTNTNISYGRQVVPSSSILPDNAAAQVYLGNSNLAAASINVTLDVSGLSIYSLTFVTQGFAHSLTHTGTNTLTLTQSMNINQTSSNTLTNAWNINAGTATVGGNLTLGSNDAGASRIAKTVLTTGTLNVTSNISFNTTVAANAVLDLSGGAGTVNLKGALTLSTVGTLSPGTTSTFNYNGSSAAQTLTIGSAVTYANVTLNNASATGITLGAAITSTNVTQNFTVASGIFTNGGFAIAGAGGKIFTVSNGATFEMTGTSVYPTGFGTFTYGATSNFQYHQTGNTSVKLATYGNLYLQPAANAITFTMVSGTVTVAGNLFCGNGVNTTASIVGTATTTLTATGGITIYANTTLDATNTNINIGGDWTNNGTFTQGAKTVTFNGASALQNINGTTATTFNNLTINKAANNVTLAKPTTVNAALTLTTGLVNTDATNLMILIAGATASSGSATSYVNGPMKKVGASNFTFPLGKGGKWARFGITFSGTPDVTTEFVAEYFASIPSNRANLQAGIRKVSAVEYWDLTRPVGASPLDDVTPTCYWESNSFSGINNPSNANLIVAHYNSSTSLWESQGQGTLTNGTAGKILAATALPSYSPISFADLTAGTDPLPINLLSFNAVLNGTKTDLAWVTGAEINNDYFTIHKSKDGDTFEELTRVTGAGNSSRELQYKTTDENPYEGISYYRLKQTDYDGKFVYSKLVAIHNKKQKNFDFKVFPNPSDGQEVFVTSDKVGPGMGEVLVVLYNAMGEIVYSKVIVSNNGSFFSAIDPYNRLLPGVYIVVGSSKEEVYKQKLIIR